jgi:hypothetical protein
MGKVFKQIQDTQKREADALETDRAVGLTRKGGKRGKRSIDSKG